MAKYSGFDTMSPWKYPFYIMLHPSVGFQELKYNKKGSKLIVSSILLLWFLEEVIYKMNTDFDFNTVSPDDINVIMLLFSTVVIFVVVTAANWCFCTLMDGKGTYKDICVVCAYALLPHIFVSLVTVPLSWFFVQEEAAILTYILLLAKLWSAWIALSGLSVIHEYSAKKTIGSVLLTVLGMLIILFIAFLCFMLLQQLVLFIGTLRMELIGR